MTTPQLLILMVLGGTVALFVWGRWRHDTVALAALLSCVALGLVEAEQAFAGFGHPAVITVACVLVLSATLQSTGAVDVMAQKVMPGSNSSPIRTIMTLTALATVMSAFMNNVGAMALLLPVAMQMANKLAIPAGQVLMPVAFGSILGGMTTLIGTPPNLIVAGFRADATGTGFGMFDFSPVGVTLAVAGVLLLGLTWRLVPARKRTDATSFETGKYLTEVRVEEDGKAAGLLVSELNEELKESEGEVLGLVRGTVKVVRNVDRQHLRPGDQLMIAAEAESLSQLVSSMGLRLIENVTPEPADHAQSEPRQLEDDAAASANEANTGTAALPLSASGEPVQDGTKLPGYQPKFSWRRVGPGATSLIHRASANDPETEETEAEQKKSADQAEVVLVEMVVLPGSALIHKTAAGLSLRDRWGINLLALSQTQREHNLRRLRQTPILEGSVLLLQGDAENLAEFASQAGCVPLAERTIRVPAPRKAALASGVMGLAIAGAALGLMPAALAFATGVLLVMFLRLLPMRQIYDSIDWSVVVLLAALIPVAGAMSATGTADLLAEGLLQLLPAERTLLILGAVLVVTMVLSDFMNNAATAAVMAPVALSTAQQLGVNPDTFLMAVAVGASCAFLTPIGHQNNTLILGPGGFKFGDYWRLGLPMEILIVLLGTPLLAWIWPLT